MPNSAGSRAKTSNVVNSTLAGPIVSTPSRITRARAVLPYNKQMTRREHHFLNSLRQLSSVAFGTRIR